MAPSSRFSIVGPFLYGGFLGLFTSEGVEIEGYVKNQPIAAAKPEEHSIREKEGFMKLAEERGVKVAKPDAIKGGPGRGEKS
jgi:hypothetical protein